MNTIQLVEKFVPVIDGIYKKASLTSVLDAPTQIDFTDGNTVKVMKVNTTGLGDYSREDGYKKGSATLEWEAMTLNEDRGAQLNIDRMDNEETLGQAFGMVMNEFIRLNVAPEVDAYRFSKYAKTAGVGTKAAALSDASAVISALRDATTAMDEAEVSEENRILFITPTYYGVIQDMDTTKSKAVLDGFSSIIKVPQTRFFTDITLNSGDDAWGFTKGSSAKNINFMVVEKSAVVQATKMALPKIFDPDTNQTSDSWLFQYRLYHDAFVTDNKVNGVYVHTAV